MKNVLMFSSTRQALSTSEILFILYFQRAKTVSLSYSLMPKLLDVMRLSMEENHVHHFLPWGLREKIQIFFFFFLQLNDIEVE